MKEKQEKYLLPIDENGKIVISMVIHDNKEFLSLYCSDNQEIITQEVASFLDSKSKLIKQNKPLHIIIKNDKISENEKKIYSKAIKNYYYNEIIDLERTLKFYLISSLILALVSIVIFSLLYTIVQNANISILSEIITVIGWVFLWEAVDLFCIRSSLLQVKRRKCKNFLNAQISFEKLK